MNVAFIAKQPLMTTPKLTLCTGKEQKEGAGRKLRKMKALRLPSHLDLFRFVTSNSYDDDILFANMKSAPSTCRRHQRLLKNDNTKI